MPSSLPVPPLKRQTYLLLFFIGLSLCFLMLLIAIFACFAYGKDLLSTLIVYQKDANEYVTLARNILNTRTFTLSSTSETVIPELFRAPLYPAFITGVLFLFKSLFALPLIQAILHVLTSLLIFEMGRRFLSRWSGAIAATIYFFEPAAIHGFMLAMSDSLFQFLFVATIFLFLYAVERSSRWIVFFFIGLLIGLLALIRPIAQFFPVVLVGSLFLVTLFNQRWKDWAYVKRHLIQSGLIILGCVFVITPWIVRNVKQANFYQISTLSTFNIFYYNIPDYYSYRQGISKQTALQTSLAEIQLTQETVNKSSAEHIERMQGSVGRFFAKHLFDYARFHALKGTIFITQSSLKTEYLFIRSHILNRPDPTPTTSFSQLLLTGDIRQALSIVWNSSREIFFFGERLFWVIATMLAFICLAFPSLRRSLITPLSLLTLLYFWGLTGPVATSRYRLPIAPVLFLLAAAFFEHALHRERLRSIQLRIESFLRHEWIRAILVSGVAFAVDVGLLITLTEVAHLPYLVSAAIGFLFGLISNYLLSIRWVFRQRSVHSVKKEFLIFSFVGLIGLGLNELFLWIFVEGIDLHYILAKFFTTGLVFFWNYRIRKHLLF